MLGIVLISHGGMADGMLNSASMFFGETGLQNVATVSLLPSEGPEDFDVKLTDAINKVETGDGVVILCDLLMGTPCNRSIYKIQEIGGEKLQVITGMNLPILVELLGMCMGGITLADLNVDNLISTAHDGIVSLNKMLNGGN